MGRRPLLYALLALSIPLPAFALEGGGAEPPARPAVLSVSASLGECGLAETTIVCRIDSSWGSVDGAEYYTASVTRADGSVVDYGTIGGGGTSLWVPYVGSGTYSLQVVAWGTPPGEDQPQVIAYDQDGTGGRPAKQTGKASVQGAGSEQGNGSTDPEAPVVDGPGQLPEEPDEPPVCEEPSEPKPPIEPGPGAPSDSEAPFEPQFPSDPAEPPPAGEPDQSIPDVSTETEAALAEEAELPESVDCP